MRLEIRFKQIQLYRDVTVSKYQKKYSLRNFRLLSNTEFVCIGSLRSEEKELEPWDASSGSVLNGELDCSLDCTLSDNNSNGWDANDMFNKNELMYGVQSTFDPSLRGYTTQLQHRDDKDFK